MNKAVIICVLSLALCLTQAAPPSEHLPPAPGAPAVKAADDKKIPDAATNATTTNSTTTYLTPEKPAAPPAKADTKPPQNDTKPTDPKTEEPKGKGNTTDNKTVPSAATLPVNPAEKPAEKSDGKTAATTPVTVKPTDAAKNVTVKPTEAPKDVTEKPPLAARGFDGSSFIGGIVLTLGLLAIGFMGLKYYKNKTERNYHTL